MARWAVMSGHSAEKGAPDLLARLRDEVTAAMKSRRHLPGCILAPEHGAGCVREQYATDDPDAPWNRPIPPEKPERVTE